MNSTTFEDFTTDARRAGFDETLVKEYAPNQVIGTHAPSTSRPSSPRERCG